MKLLTKKELQDQLETAHTSVSEYQSAIDDLKSGKVSMLVLSRMLGKGVQIIEKWVAEGMPYTRTPPSLFPTFEVPKVVSWLQEQAHQLGRIEAQAEIAELKTKIGLLEDVPPALPQDVVDILDMSSAVVSERLEDMYDLLSENAVHPGFVDDEDDVLDVIKTLGIMQSRIRAALLADFEWHSKERLAVTEERLAKSLAKTAEANAKLAQDLAA